MDVAVQHFRQAAALLARHHRRDIDLGEDALLAERLREQRPVAHFFAHGFDVGLELGVGEALGQQVEALQNRQAGADQGDELLIEDEKFFEIELLAPAESKPTPAGSAA